MLTNRLTLANLQDNDVSLEAIANAPVSELAMVQDDLKAAEADLKRAKARLSLAMTARFPRNKKLGADSQIVDGYKVTSTVAKKVTWDQDKLAEFEQTIINWGDEPRDYITVKRSITETAFNNWPERLQGFAMPARTVEEGSISFKIEEAK